jgi:hypothetical protein
MQNRSVRTDIVEVNIEEKIVFGALNDMTASTISMD